MWGNSFPISVVTAGLHPIPHSFHLPSLLPTGPSPLLQPRLHTPCAIQGHSTGALFCPVINSKPKLLHLASQAPWCNPLQHTASTALGVTSHQRNSADFPHVPEPSTAETTGQQQHISHAPGLSLGCYNCLSESPDLPLQGC